MSIAEPTTCAGAASAVAAVDIGRTNACACVPSVVLTAFDVAPSVATRPDPFCTWKNRLPSPSARPWLSVTAHTIVWSPLANLVVSRANTPIAAVAVRDVRHVREQRRDVVVASRRPAGFVALQSRQLS